MEHFDAVVVGSGFGGAVSACRLADAGLSVCVLERGRPYPPGSFPRTPRALAASFWNPTRRRYGLFDLRSFRHRLVTLAASGLGGGSLVFAGVLLRKDERWFVRENGERWPLTRADLDPYYARVERTLGAGPYPFETGAPYRDTPKTRQLVHAAARLGLDWHMPNLAVTFANPGCAPEVGAPIDAPDNLHGAPRSTCHLCGECDLGCNHGSKNSLDLTYLSAAWRRGAEVRTLCEVREIAPHHRGYVVRYVDRGPAARGGRMVGGGAPLVEVTAGTLVLAAGTLGTTELLLRNRGNFPRLSSMLGRRFSTNGDLLTFAVGRGEPGDRNDGGGCAPRFAPSFGPVITCAVRVRDAAEGGTGRGCYLEDGGYPSFLAGWVRSATGPSARARLMRLAARRAWSRMTDGALDGLGEAIGPALGRAARDGDALPLLGMGRDIPDGVIALRDGRLDIAWTPEASAGCAARLREASRAIAAVWGADLVECPPGEDGAITVHPLGGCPMGRHPGEGVVDSWGQVFHYPGLHVADGSVMPGPVGPNPALTIAALADRFADRMIATARRGRGRA